jgi:hypothetical protein
MADMRPAGPGKYTRRTDLARDNVQTRMDVPSSGYGEGAETAGFMASAPMAEAQQAAPMIPLPDRALGAPTMRRDEPITAGAPFGEGPGREVLPVPPAAPDETAQTLRALAAVYPDPDLIRLVSRLDAEGR